MVLSVQTAYSCSCFQISNEEEIKITDFIFVGKVVEITEDKSYIPSKIPSPAPGQQLIIIEGVTEFQPSVFDSRKRYLIKFKVDRKFKGVEEDEITLVKYEEKLLLYPGIDFEKGKTYLVYADKNEDSEEISDNGTCSRTRNFDKDSKDYKELLNLKSRKQKQQKKS
jgi:hypothetical protein